MPQEPVLRREGNLRFAGRASMGYPEDPEASCARVRTLLADQDLRLLGPATLLFTLPPDGPPSSWECSTGLAMVGLARPVGDLLIEDYAGLYAATLPHHGPISDLPGTHRRLVEHVKAMGRTLRPYWRVALWRRRLADGNPLPVAEVSVFIDA